MFQEPSRIRQEGLIGLFDRDFHVVGVLNPAVDPLSMPSQMAKRGIRTRNEFQPNSQRQKPLRFGAGARSWTGSGLTSIQPSRMSAFALELETVSSFPVSMFRTVRNRTWFIEAPPTYSPFSC